MLNPYFVIQPGVTLKNCWRKLYCYAASRACLGLAWLWRKSILTDCGELQIWGNGLGRRIIPIKYVTPHMLCYCAGVGEDTAFDEELLELGHTVIAFDPTPRAAAHVKNRQLQKKSSFSFEPIGIFSSAKTLQLTLPANPEDESWSILPIITNGKTLKVACKSIYQIVTERGGKHPDLLKLDIEGCEHETIRGMIRDGVLPKILLVEFDQPASPFRMYRTVKLLFANGYKLAAIDVLNFSFIEQ